MRGYQRAVSEHGVIIVGSGPADLAAAESFREHDTSSAVRMLTADPALPYARPPLSKEYLRGQIDDVGLHPRRWFDDRRSTSSTTRLWTPWILPSAPYALGGGVIGSTP